MKKVLVAIVVIGMVGWLVLSSGGPKAPLKDGLYLQYDLGGGSTTRVAFSKVSENEYKVTVTPGNRETIIDGRMRTKKKGRPFEVDWLGPLWIPPASIKEGGKAHGSNVSEVKRWEKWDVGVINASFGGEALTGTWYYDKTSGFLVGGSRTTLMVDDGGMHYVLRDTNL